MKIVLLAGGIGSRLWPISTKKMPKQFVKILKKDDKYESMLERIYRQVSRIYNVNDIYISTNEEYSNIVNYQLSYGVNLITEKENKNTSAAIFNSALYLKEKMNVNNETVVFIPIDSYVNDEYYNILKKLDESLKERRNNVSIVGIENSVVSSEYGYILHNNSKVIEFVEKPSLETAKNFVENGALINSGIIAFDIDFLVNFIKEEYGIEDYTSFLNKTSLIPNIPIDKEILENCKNYNICVENYSGNWEDIGCWNKLINHIDKELFENEAAYNYMEIDKNEINDYLEVKLDNDKKIEFYDNKMVLV